MKTAILTCAVLSLMVGCKDSKLDTDTKSWSQPEIISNSRDSLSTDFSLQKWNNTLIAFNEDGRGFTTYVFQENEMTWDERRVNQSNWLPLDCSAIKNRVIISRGTVTQHQLDLRFISGSITEAGTLSLGEQVRLSETTESLFAPKSDLIFANASRPLELRFNRSVIKGGNIYVPYSIEAQPVFVKGQIPDRNSDVNGMFYSSNSGASWKAIKISDSFSILPSACATKNYIYYFAADYDRKELWFSRAGIDSALWSPPQAFCRTLAVAAYRHTYETVGDSDTVHVCWLDSRHERRRANPVYPGRENYEVAYCHRKDSDASWSKDVILSKGLLYAYSPSISVEGENIVVAWAGANDKDGHNEFWPNDIYYAISKDGGNTWTKPVRITEGFKDGITSGRPQVALHNGVIHLFYIQGKLNYEEVSAGMVKLNQPPWPIYYTQRPFPN